MSARPPHLLPWLTTALLVLPMVCTAGYYLYLKGVAGRNARELAVDWNASRRCSITTYAPSLGEQSIRSRFFHFFSASTLFRVHDKEGHLLRSSEWLLWQTEAGDSEAPRWVSEGRVVYPTTQGYEQWELPECDAGR